MASKVHIYDKLKLFKIGKLNLQKKAKDWYKKLKPLRWSKTTTQVSCTSTPRDQEVVYGKKLCQHWRDNSH